MKTHEVRVTFQNGQKLITKINGSKEQVSDYYAKGNMFNLGSGENDLMSAVVKLEFLNERG